MIFKKSCWKNSKIWFSIQPHLLQWNYHQSSIYWYYFCLIFLLKSGENYHQSSTLAFCLLIKFSLKTMYSTCCLVSHLSFHLSLFNLSSFSIKFKSRSLVYSLCFCSFTFPKIYLFYSLIHRFNKSRFFIKLHHSYP